MSEQAEKPNQGPEMEKGRHYNWKCEPDRKLVYLGCNWSGNGYWHQFALADDSAKEVWCEITDKELPLIEEFAGS